MDVYAGTRVECGCGAHAEVDEAYFCATCTATVCSLCTTTSVESFYCPNCLDSMAAGDAALFANRCSKCFECPACSAALTTLHIPPNDLHHAPLAHLALDADQLADGIHALVCPFCAWSSLDLGLAHPKPDVLILDSVKKQRAAADAPGFAALVDAYQRAARDTAKAAERSKRLLKRGLLDRNASSKDMSHLLEGLGSGTSTPVGGEPAPSDTIRFPNEASVELAADLPIELPGPTRLVPHEPITVLAVERRMQEKHQEMGRWVQYGEGAVNPPLRYAYDGLALERKTVIKSEMMGFSDDDDDEEARAVRAAERKKREDAEDAQFRAVVNAARAAARPACVRDPYAVMAGEAGAVDDLASLSSLTQRHANVHAQPRRFADLMPLRRRLRVRRRIRCNGCERILIRPDISPSSVKFKIHQTALEYLPWAELAQPLDHAGLLAALASTPPQTPVVVRLSLANPLDEVVGVRLLPLAGDLPDDIELSPSGRLHDPTSRLHSAAFPPTLDATFAAGGSTHLEARVDLAELDMFDPDESDLRTDDTPELIASRSRHRATVLVHLTPRLAADSLAYSKFGFRLVLTHAGTGATPLTHLVTYYVHLPGGDPSAASPLRVAVFDHQAM
ncbi:uncharacterized protein AMSG_10926 [Thecamonas trahens ATCC 50062]|uniref:Dynactin subunit 4 n=1 Tax=Thecamonas trahens ATCC 50062 TaxID=461836 RepID=A0A0L0DSN9_THETB|nr:hypothetical protein AMSG_10926 [Thecamonas trahens ATCC 50062]KNC55285.1 hypothetical protein AMSG_10926 [Thecamonas trahens ATCC 50062]|eukprot:XP_013753106.1 hypothetical protein AMSG_10926 [Thecamonas trahens ATCC 50062]